MAVKKSLLLAVYASILVFLASAPSFLSKFILGNLTEIMIFGIFAMSLDILIGYTGLVSFGHAAFLGLGTYSAALLILNNLGNIGLIFLAAVIVSVIIAFIIGYFSTKTTGVYFIMITLAFAQMLYSVAFKFKDITGGSDGLSGISRPLLLGISMDNYVHFYYFTLIISLFCYLILLQIVKSPLGNVLVGIKENENRMLALGYNTTKFKIVSFVISGAFGGIAGVLNVLYTGYASPDIMRWTISGEGIVMVILGGFGTLHGPFIGAAFFLTLQNIVSSYTDQWLLIVGVIFVIFVIFLRSGIAGIIKKGWEKIR